MVKIPSYATAGRASRKPADEATASAERTETESEERIMIKITPKALDHIEKHGGHATLYPQTISN